MKEPPNMKIFLAFAAMSAMSLAACAAPTEGAADSNEDELKSTVRADGYFELRPDLRRCASPLCGGVFVHLVNQSTTACTTGEAKDACYAASVDTSALHLPEALATRIASGGNVVVKGQLRDKTFDKFGNLGVLKVTEAYAAPDTATDGAADDRYYFVKREHIACITFPCPEIYETSVLNFATQPISTVNGLDLAKATTSPDEQALVNDAAFAGVIVLGHEGKQGLVASKYLVKATPVMALTGAWGADGATMSVAAGKAQIEFGCGFATIDSFHFTDATSFTASGSHIAGSGVMFPPDQQPKPVPATFTGTLKGDTLTIQMTVDTEKSKVVFTKGREVNLIRCL
jgi:hypothetical protein